MESADFQRAGCNREKWKELIIETFIAARNDPEGGMEQDESEVVK